MWDSRFAPFLLLDDDNFSIVEEKMNFNPASLIYVTYEQLNKERERSLAHYPSGLCAIDGDGFVGRCRRSLFYDMTGVKKSDPIEGIALFKMDIGNLIHKRCGQVIDDALGLMSGDEVPVKWRERGLLYPVSGKLDKVTRYGGKNIGVEWKSTYGRGVTDVKNNGPKEDAMLQVIAYLRQKKILIDEYVLSYIARDSGYIYSFLFFYEEKKLHVRFLNSNVETICDWKWANIKKALLTVEEAVESGKAPARDYKAKVVNSVMDKKSSWRCRYCAWRSRCWENATSTRSSRG